MAGIAATYIDADSFTVEGDKTTEFCVGRRVKANCQTDGYKYGTIESSSYSNPDTTVDLYSTNDDLTSNLIEVEYGVISEGLTGSVPRHTHDNAEGSGGSLSASVFYVDSTETDQGVAGNGLTIKALVDAIGSDKGTIYLRHNSGSAETTYILTTNETIPSNITLEIENGAIIDGAGTLTVNSPKNGVVTVFPVTDGNSFNVLLPDGTWLDTTGSTTQGLQEAVDVMAANGGWDLKVIGGDSGSGSAVTYWCTTTLTFPPMQGKSIKFGAVTLNMDVSTPSHTGVRFDSCMMVDVDMRGAQIVYHGTGIALDFLPVNPVPLDAVITIAASRFRFATIVALESGANVIAVRFNPNAGTIGMSFFEFFEIAGGGRSIRVTNPGVGFSFRDSFITCPLIHGFNSVSIELGTEATRATFIESNTFKTNMIIDGAQIPTKMIDIWGSNNIFIGAFHDKACFTSNIIWEAPAVNNLVISNGVNLAKISNYATVKNNKVSYAGTKTYAAITPGASAYVYQNTSSVEQVVVVGGGTVSAIDYSVDNSNYYSAGATAGSFPVPVGMYLRVTYSVVPTMHRFY